ncbi:MAG TPA: LysR family transcriptional regulator [Baekduia sp.]|uniref:LysR family transcriptional regulator n=1 Tax=Baekduia sp. TaxID=2600305 RepID=UPI002D7A0300|nr:LysR family transcriptional regulator [Baekduia sp.]HET6508357.1 LysR family transcriptional regulator [Baekduia sp.]
MLDLRRLRLLHELHERGTIAAVADALRFTPSAVSQQLATLERETGVKLIRREGRGVRLTDQALVLVGHAAALLQQAERAEADLAAAAGEPAGRGRIAAFQSVALNIATPAIARLARTAPRLRTELIAAEPEESLPALALGDLDLVLADEWVGQPLPRLPGLDRHDLHREPVLLALPAEHPAAQGDPAHPVELRRLRDAAWVAAPPGGGWESLILRTCRELGGFEPAIRHRTNDALVAQRLVAHGQAVTLLPELTGPADHPGVVARTLREGAVHRTILAAVRSADAHRPSTRALLAAVQDAGRARGWS